MTPQTTPRLIINLTFMLDTNDIRVLQGMFEASENKTEARFKQLDQKINDLESNLRDQIHSTVSASEQRMTAKIAAAIEASERKIILDICDFLDQAIIPQLDQHDHEIKFIKHTLKLA